MKLDSNFKMKKPTKRMLALSKFKSPEHKGTVKRLFISAQLSEMEAERSKFSKASTDSTTLDS